MTETVNLFEQQAANRRKSWWLVAGFLVFFAWLGFGGDLILWLASRGTASEVGYVHRFPWLGLVTTAVGLWIVRDVRRSGAKKVLWSTGAVPLDNASTPEERQLENVVDEMAIAAGVPRPKVYIIPDPDPNAFVTGNSPLESHLAVTRGLLETLNRDELQAVVAHELGHVKNEDTQLMTLVAALGGAILLMRDGAARVAFRSGGRGSRSRGGNGKGGNPLIILLLVLWIVSWLLAPLVTRLMAMGISRKREFLADAMAAQFTRNPMALADALDKIERSPHPTKSITAGAAHLCIADPTQRWANSHEGRVADLFATHPPMRLRVSRLRAMAYADQKRAGN